MLAIILAAAITIPAAPCAPVGRDIETRYASTPSHPEARHASVLAAFKRAHPCPSNGKSSGPCAGWVLDHVVPLACLGQDSVSNLQWLPTAMWKAKSLWERRIYLRPGDRPTAYCR